MTFRQKLSYNKELTPQTLIKMLIDPVLIILTLVALMFYFEEPITPKYFVAIMIIFALSFPGSWSRAKTLWEDVAYVFSSWIFIAGILLFFGYATSFLWSFPHEVVFNWLWLTPLVLLLAHLAFAQFLTSIKYTSYVMRSAVIVGISDLGIQLRDRMNSEADLGLQFRGFFDDRSYQRHNSKLVAESEIRGKFAILADYVKKQAVDIIYIALPMTSEPRVLELLDDLKDTTTSIYFVPNVFMFDLIQARISDVAGIPVIAVCETPFSGMNGLVKRVSDIVLATIILLLISPILLALAIGVKLSSPGPIFFKQRRYGLDGQQIIVYKFRSMTVSEDGDKIVQATRNDSRITPFGNFMRKTSLDELPQFFNVLQGRMSIVGPRPHAVAHNEAYRKVIKGYMIRHKVRPGITGWAQINGLRGETETVEKMKARIDYDLDYLRQWSLSLDMKIIWKTIALVFTDTNAY
ncbi:MAG: undecaprenyl-phosphate glucose phosphotransferase [Methylophilaceae bacterium]